jgi:glycosyltransferase involved in cell wall biosynthesis
MSTRRIGIDVTAALTQGGGIGRYTRELVRAVVDLDSYNHYRLFSARLPKALPVADPLPQQENVTHRPAPLTEQWLYRLWYRARLPLPVQWVTGSLDLFHSPDFVLPPVAGGIPTLLTVHDLSFVHFPETFPQPLVSYLNRVVPWSVARATHVLADSEATRNDLLDVWGVPSDKVSVLYSGVSETFRPVRDVAELTAVRRRYHLDDQPYVLVVGTVQPRKNYEMLIRAFGQIADRVPHTLAIAGGKGWMEEGMLAEVSRLGLERRVRFLGFVDDADLPVLYSAADLMAMPSLYEGFGLPVLEAMACGTPAIIANSSSLPEVGGAAALQLPPEDTSVWAASLLALLNDGKQRAQMAAAGLQQAGLFSWQGAAAQLIDLYAALLDKPPASGHN